MITSRRRHKPSDEDAAIDAISADDLFVAVLKTHLHIDALMMQAIKIRARIRLGGIEERVLDKLGGNYLDKLELLRIRFINPRGHRRGAKSRQGAKSARRASLASSRTFGDFAVTSPIYETGSKEMEWLPEGKKSVEGYRYLNTLRNGLAHTLNHEITTDDVIRFRRALSKEQKTKADEYMIRFGYNRANDELRAYLASLYVGMRAAVVVGSVHRTIEDGELPGLKR